MTHNLNLKLFFVILFLLFQASIDVACMLNDTQIYFMEKYFGDLCCAVTHIVLCIYVCKVNAFNLESCAHLPISVFESISYWFRMNFKSRQKGVLAVSWTTFMNMSLFSFIFHFISFFLFWFTKQTAHVTANHKKTILEIDWFEMNTFNIKDRHTHTCTYCHIDQFNSKNTK